MIKKVYISKLYLSVFLLFALYSSIARSETNINLYLVCNEHTLSSSSQKIWNKRNIIFGEAISYKNILDKRIEELTRFREIARTSGDIEAMQRYGDESFKLLEKRIRAVSKYQIQITELNIALRNGREANCFRTGVKLGVKIRTETTTGKTFVKVIEVSSGSLAERIGMKVGDTILALNSQAIGDSYELQNMLKSFNSGDLLDFKISRGGIILFVNTLSE